MIEIKIAGFGNLRLKYLVLDFNGTLAVDGRMIKGVNGVLNKLAKKIKIYVLTADTFGNARAALKYANCELHVLEDNGIDLQKEDFVRKLGAENTIGIGNGRNDRKMLEISRLGIVVMGKEGYSIEAMSRADVVVADILDGLNLLLKPRRLVATLRTAGG